MKKQYIIALCILAVLIGVVGVFALMTGSQSVAITNSRPTAEKRMAEKKCRKFLEKEASDFFTNTRLSAIRSLDFQYNINVFGPEFDVLRETPNVQELNFHYAIKLDDRFSASLKHTPLVRVLNLFGTLTTKESIDAIAALRNLEYLRLGYAFDSHKPLETRTIPFPFSDTTLMKLQSCQNLTHLYIGEQCTISDKGLRYLENYKKLEYLGLVTPNITPDGIDFLKTLLWVKKIEISLPAKERELVPGKVLTIKTEKIHGLVIIYHSY